MSFALLRKSVRSKRSNAELTPKEKKNRKAILRCGRQRCFFFEQRCFFLKAPSPSSFLFPPSSFLLPPTSFGARERASENAKQFRSRARGLRRRREEGVTLQGFRGTCTQQEGLGKRTSSSRSELNLILKPLQFCSFNVLPYLKISSFIKIIKKGLFYIYNTKVFITYFFNLGRYFYLPKTSSFLTIFYVFFLINCFKFNPLRV